jgi:Leucine-rich repeat (LRR) protein
MLQVEDVNLAGTGITSLPDLSGLAKLRGLTIAETPIRSLNNLETVRSDFDLDVWGCDQLDDIDALLYARVRTLTIDENNYERLRDWFASHLSEIKAKRKFSVEFQLPSRE